MSLEIDATSGVVTFNVDEQFNLKACILNSPSEGCKVIDNNEYRVAVRHARQKDGLDTWSIIINNDTKARIVNL